MNEIIQGKDKAQVWRERIEAQVLSGKPAREFCKEQQISASNFYGWRKKLNSFKPRKTFGRFIAMQSKARYAGGVPRIHLPNGVQIELGERLESEAVSQFIRNLCGVGHAKP